MEEFPYAEVGATEYDELPVGYRHVRRRVRLGAGGELFDRAGNAVMTFGVQRGAGLRPRSTEPRAVAGVEITCRLGVGRLGLVLPCRVVWAREDEATIGFGYGTLPGHPERGEEAFVVSRDGDGAVWFEIRAFSQPQRWFARAAGPVGHLMQDLITNRYVHVATRF